MWVGIARQEALQTNDVRTVFGANQHRTSGASLDQGNAAQDQRMHDPFAEFGLFDHQGAQIFRRNQQCFDIIDRVNVDERRLTRQLPHFGNEVTGSLLHDRGAMPEGIATRAEPLISTYMPGATLPVTNSASPGA